MLPIRTGYNSERTLNKVVASVASSYASGGNKKQDDIYGVCYDEFKDLIQIDDVFNVAGDCVPDPPIEEETTQIKLYKTIDTGFGPAIINQMGYNFFLPGYTIVCYGPRRSGKSVLIRNICQRMRQWFPWVVVFTETKASGEYAKFIPHDHIIEGLDEDLLGALIDHQKGLKEKRSNGEDVGNSQLLIILDDCMSDELRYKKIFNKLFYEGRHYDITIIVALQDIRGIAPACTANTDVACSFQVPDKRTMEALNEKFASYFHKKQFCALMESPDILKAHHVMFFDQAHRFNPVDKRIYYGCVDTQLEERFIMGDKEMWKESPKQLAALGFEYMMQLDDWGILIPEKTRETEKRDVKPLGQKN